MNQGISLYSIIPCREEPSHKSQLVSQLLFGEKYTVLAEVKDWIQIESVHDHYLCWIAANQHHTLEGTPDHILNTGLHTMVQKGEDSFPVTLGCYLPAGKMIAEGDTFTTGTTLPQPPDEMVEALHYYGKQLLYAPYLWGGRTHLGIDCSGFSQLMYRMLGKSILRDAWQQAEEGETVSFIHEAAPGDLAFFDNEEGKITHVGIVLGEHRIIHASGSVRIDTLDHEGIYNSTLKKYTHRLRILKRYF